MKKIIFLSLLGFSGIALSQSTVDKVVKKSCDCMNKTEASILSYDDFMGVIVTCISPEINANLASLKKELGVTEKDMVKSMEQVGAKLGERMVFGCPKFADLTFKLLGEDKQFQAEAIEEVSKGGLEMNSDLVEGEITEVDFGNLCQITVKTEINEIVQIYWIDQANVDVTYVTNPSKLKGKKAKIVYLIKSIYDAKQGKYVSRKVLQEITF
jgi:hypothetical protein